MPKKAATKKGANKPSKPVKKPAAKKAEKAPETVTPPTELELANQKIAELEKEVETLKGVKPAEVEKATKPPGCSLSFPSK